MNKGRLLNHTLLPFLILLVSVAAGVAQDKDKDKKKSSEPAGKPVLWEQVNVAERDLYNGPGGEAMKPDLSKVDFIEEDTSGHNKKYRIRDAKGTEWIAKLGSEAQPETAAVRILYGLGYRTEINYLVPSITIPTKGTFKNVRLEARPKNAKRLDQWAWKDNPFVGSNELQGLKIMMVFFTNWDLLDMQNKVVRVTTPDGVEDDYIISDLGATFGRLGNNNLPFFFRLGRQTNKPDTWEQAGFIKGVNGGKLEFDFTGGKSRDIMNDVTTANGRWLADLLEQLSDKQLDDVFRAANYTPDQIATLRNGFKTRVAELDKATRSSNTAFQ
jgi:hypothetical protein